MTLPRALVLAATSVVLAGCPGDDAPPGPNPDRLWLGLDGSEVQVKLVTVEPPPF